MDKTKATLLKSRILTMNLLEMHFKVVVQRKHLYLKVTPKPIMVRREWEGSAETS